MRAAVMDAIKAYEQIAADISAHEVTGTADTDSVEALRVLLLENERLYRFGVHMLVVHEQRSAELAHQMMRDARAPDHDTSGGDSIWKRENR